MQIRELFTKAIDRPINGVIKADQKDAESIWQELDEYVVTKQLTDHFRRFFDAYLAAADNPNDPVLGARMGVWVSGFFGSGKSHFIKILSYLLESLQATNPATGERKRAAAFFDERKIKDPMLLADIQRAVRGSADVILFNIDAKADSKDERDVILQVFLRVFNEKLGFSADAPHIAHMERYLVEKDAYDTFKSAFAQSNGSTWEAERDAVDFLRDDVVHALAVALKQSDESAGQWFDRARDEYRINIESFARLVRDYLDTRPAGHRIIFLVDEVGQFIGDNTQLMLTLQTITEQLGTATQGRAWVIVTSQEDIDAALGEANKAKSQDFSKIQGRFHTRLSLASSNTDEVIGERLLAKTEAAHGALRDTFEKSGDIINNQLAFVGNSVNLRSYKDAAEFVGVYPYAPYQFTLLQKVFESIRKVGATGKHLSRGERSLLDAFQSAAVRNADHPVGLLIPLYDFYPSIESFIDTVAKRSIDEAPQNGALEAYDVLLLKALFLIRYIGDIVKPNVDNLATLCVDRIDTDKLALKRKIQESLARLEAQRLVSRNGDLWFFLTNEERDVAREIGNVEVPSAEKARLLCELLFDDILQGATRIRHRDTKGDYDFNRLLDGVPYKNATHELSVEIVSPLGDDYETLSDARAVLRSSEGHGRALIKLAEGERFDIELNLYRQIEKYIDSPKASNATPSLRTILLNRKDENRERRTRLREQLSAMLLEGDCYALGQRVELKAGNASSLLDELGNYLITNTYTKLGYLKHRNPDPTAEIKAVLLADDISQKKLALGGDEGNPLALAEMREYLQLKASASRVMLDEVVARFTGIPWGWKPEWEVVLLVARLFMAGEIKLVMDSADLVPRAAIEPLTKSARFKQVSILKRKVADVESIKKARKLHQELFSSLPPEDEDGFVAAMRTRLAGWHSELKGYAPLAATKHHPGKTIIDTVVARIGKQLAIADSFEFVESLVKDRDAWLDLADDAHDVTSFYKTQRPTWQRLLDALERYADNHDALDKNIHAAAALGTLESLRDNSAPWGMVSQIEPLIATVDAINEELAQGRREHALLSVDAKIAEVEQALDAVHADAALRNRALLKLQELKTKVAGLTSIPMIFYCQDQAGDALDAAMAMIEAATPKTAPGTAAEHGNQNTATKTGPTVAPPKPSKVVRVADLAGKTYLETEAEVDAYLVRLKSELLKIIQAGQRARLQ
ncbi:BREX system P-loop protein BrxC [Aromatoleum aromaticum]|uniref:ATPase-like protein n=1 Tax=Aromatoleum aromaticum (strain DSM 19018 / LMG 30748 / EbN1) TaxID=76114 RepID=Q5P0S7_AROAE|nr:BREX system P-loop protein BrxC [Aromatoleum aromaticum]NMG56280.1 BREX system P-loop protein BrxC [Aromatoleum aromaticum]CAI09087.1 ATPase-like protein [Aromatoleum aromaticum EbN1]